MEDFSGASFLGKLLVLPANVRLDWKVIARHKHSGLFGLIICNEEKKSYDIDTRDGGIHYRVTSDPKVLEKANKGKNSQAELAYLKQVSLS